MAGRVLSLLTCCAVGVAAFYPAGAAALTVGGPICADTTWHVADSPIVATASVVVGGPLCDGTPPTLTIDPGVQVLFGTAKLLEINATLVAHGTPEAPIRFDSSMPAPRAGDWLGIHFTSLAASARYDADLNYVTGTALENVVIAHAGDTGAGVVTVASTSPLLHEITVTQSKFTAAAFATSGSAAPRVVGLHVTENMGGIRAVSIASSVGIALSGLHVRGNTSESEAVRVNTTAGPVAITGADIADNVGTGLVIGAKTTITDSTVSGNSGTGIQDCGSSELNTLRNVTIAGNGGIGLRADCASVGTLTVDGCTIADNTGGGILLSKNVTMSLSGTCVSGGPAGPSQARGVYVTAGTAVIRKTTIVKHASSAIRVDGNGVVDVQMSNLVNDDVVLANNRAAGTPDLVAENDWWGTADGATISGPKIADFFDDGHFGIVDFMPFAAAAIPGAPDIDSCLAGMLVVIPTTTTTTTSTTSTSTSTTSTTRSTSSTTSSSTSTSSSSSTTSSTTSTVISTTSTSSTTTTSTSATSSTTGTNATTSSTSTSMSTSTSHSSTIPTSTTSTTASTFPSTSSSTVVVTTSTTSTSQPHCGNGSVETALGEQCDPGVPSSADCCTRQCQAFRVNQDCTTRVPDVCEVGDKCDTHGVCLTVFRGAETVCRDPETNGPCDAGDTCDGKTATCPVTGDGALCSGDVTPPPPGTRSLVASCQAPAIGRPRCTAVGFAGTNGAGRAAGSGACLGTRVTTRVTERLRRSSDPHVLTRDVKLSLTPFGRKLLRQRQSVDVCVQVTIVFAPGLKETRAQIVRVTR